MSSAETGREGRKRKRLPRDGDADLDLYSNTERVISELVIKIKEVAEKAWQKKRDKMMKRVASEVRSMLYNVESKLKEERQKFVDALLKHSKECLNAMIIELEKSLKEDGISSSTLLKHLCSSLDNASVDHASLND